MTLRRIQRLYGFLDRLQRRSVLARLGEGLERQGGSERGLQDYAQARLARLLAHALAEVPFYRERLSALSADPERLAGPLFAEIPPLEKAEIGENADRLVSRLGATPPGGVNEVRSGGTTGPPTRILLDGETMDRHAAATLRSFLWFGADPTRRHVLLWGPPPEENPYGFLSGRLKGLVLRRTLLPTFGLDAGTSRKYWEWMRRRRLHFVAGYSSALVQVAGAARPGERLRVATGIIAAAEPLFSFQRPMIEEAFGAPVRERYGCNEFALLAQECSAGSLHLASDRVRLELVDSRGAAVGPGEIGDVLVTDLDNLYMPLIRYRIGDRARWGEACGCGLPFPVLERIHGRVRDEIRAEDGRTLSPHSFADELRGTRATGLQLLVDDSRRLREVLLQAEPFPCEGILERWIALAGNRGIRIRFVAGLPRSASGKILPVARRDG